MATEDSGISMEQLANQRLNARIGQMLLEAEGRAAQAEAEADYFRRIVASQQAELETLRSANEDKAIDPQAETGSSHPDELDLDRNTA